MRRASYCSRRYSFQRTNTHKMRVRSACNFLIVCLCITTFTVLVKCQGNQVQCFDSCGPSAVTLSLSSSAAICCASGGSAFIDLLDESAGCQLCSDLEDLDVQLTVSSTEISEGRNGSLQCVVSSDQTDNLTSNIQLFGPDGRVLAQSDAGVPSDSITYDFTPFQSSDYGDYTCAANVTSPDFPGVERVFVSRTVSIPRPPGGVTINGSTTTPFAGEVLTLTCTVGSEDQPIQWVGPDGMLITNGDGILVGETISSGGVTTSTLTFPNLRTSQVGRYTCLNPVANVTQRIVANVPVPQVTIMTPVDPPVVGRNYEAKCTGAVPTSLQGTVMATWIAPNGTVLVSNSSQDMVCLPLPFQPFESENLGTYQCQIVVSSPFVTGQIGNSETFTIRQVVGTDRPTNTPEETETPDTTTETTSTITPELPDSTFPTTGMTTTAQQTTMIPRTTIILPTEATTSDSVLTPTTPRDINECERGTDNCNRRKVCRYAYHGIYRRMYATCTRIGVCTNTDAGFTCRCASGFEGDGVNCKDINECRQGTDNCHPQAECQNKVGSFKCHCKRGDIGDGVKCCMSMNVVFQFANSKHAKTDRSDSKSSRSSRRSSRSKRSKKNRSKSSKSSKSSRSSSSNSSETDTQDETQPDVPVLDPACNYFLHKYGAHLSARRVNYPGSFVNRSMKRQFKSSRRSFKKRRG